MCAFYAITGFTCPFCGGTRATIALLEGRVLDSIGYNILVLFGVMVFLYTIYFLVKNVKGGKSLNEIYVPLWFPLLTSYFIVFYTVLRNVSPLFSFLR